jgi:tetratricopeptide (TPR) repeat protein
LSASSKDPPTALLPVLKSELANRRKVGKKKVAIAARQRRETTMTLKRLAIDKWTNVSDLLGARRSARRKKHDPTKTLDMRSTFTLLVIILFSMTSAYTSSGSDDAHNQPTVSTRYAGIMLKALQQRDQVAEREYDLEQYAQRGIAAYENTPANQPKTNLFKTAVAYAFKGQVKNAVVLLKSCLNEIPNDQNSLLLMGLILFTEEKYPEAETFLKAAWVQGNSDALAFLGNSYVLGKQPAEFLKIAPQLLKRKDEITEYRDVLAIYASTAVPPDNDLFARTVEGMADSEILKREGSVISYYILGFWNQGEKGRALKIQATAGATEGYRVFTDDPARRKDVINTYESHPEWFSPSELRVVGVSYLLERRFTESKTMFEKFVKVKSDDAVGWRGLGASNLMLSNLSDAITDFERGWQLKDLDCLKGLADCYLQAGQAKEVKPLVTDMLDNRGKDIEFVGALASYSMLVQPMDKDTFVKAIEGLNDDAILGNKINAIKIIDGLQAFGQTKRAEKLEAERLRREKQSGGKI